METHFGKNCDIICKISWNFAFKQSSNCGKFLEISQNLESLSPNLVVWKIQKNTFVTTQNGTGLKVEIMQYSRADSRYLYNGSDGISYSIEGPRVEILQYSRARVIDKAGPKVEILQ